MHRANEIKISTVIISSAAPVVPFIVEPILHALTDEVFGFEVLFRGPHPVYPESWSGVDEQMLHHLAAFKMSAPIFVNLGNDTILTVDEELLLAANANNSLFFEWSELIGDDREFNKVIARINYYTKMGLRFVIDDFGKGRCGLERLFSVDNIHALKVDGGMFRKAAKNAMAAKMIENIVVECSKRGILTVGECIETGDDYRVAESLGFDLLQGWHVSDRFAANNAAGVVKAA